MSGQDERSLGLRDVAGAFERCFASLDHVVLAVSGGSDSTALLLLADEWRRARGSAPPSFSVLTIDHGLREGSAAEAAAVGALAATLGLAHAILHWEGAKPASGIQVAARNERRALIARHLSANGWSAVALAHTREDQAETLLMRLARGSGVDGLAAMSERSTRDGVRVLRPLLDVSREELRAYLRARGAGWSEDPGNESPAFERVRWRQKRELLDAAGLTSRSLARSARRLDRARRALEKLTRPAFDGPDAAIRVDPLGYAEIDWVALCRHPEEIRLRALKRVIAVVGGSPEPVPLDGLEAMTEGKAWVLPIGCTLARVVFGKSGRGRLLVTREYGRELLPVIDLEPGGEAIWDGRFRVVIGAQGRVERLQVGALGPVGLAMVEREGGRRPAVATRALWSLPAFSIAGELVAVPSLGFVRHGGIEGLYTAEFRGSMVIERP